MTTAARGAGTLASDSVKLLLDGQQRITSLYGIMRGKPPQFFDRHEQAFTETSVKLRPLGRRYKEVGPVSQQFPTQSSVITVDLSMH
jgi:hypothetical protein